jgi:hypothetical protein
MNVEGLSILLGLLHEYLFHYHMHAFDSREQQLWRNQCLFSEIEEAYIYIYNLILSSTLMVYVVKRVSLEEVD